MMEKEIEYKGYIIRQDYDEFAEDPREGFDIKFLAFGQSRLMDWEIVHDYYSSLKVNIIAYMNLNEDFDFSHITELDFDDLDEDEELADKVYAELEKQYHISPLSIYQHSGTCVMKGVHNGWDCWLAGVAYLNREDLTEDEFELHLDYMLELYNGYINGECYTVYIDNKDGDVVDSFSYIGVTLEDNMIDRAKEDINNIILYNKDVKELKLDKKY